MTRWDRNDHILFGVFLAALAAIVLSAAASAPESKDVAAWFEGIGVVGAMIVAIVMPLKTEQDRRDEEAYENGLRTYSVAHSLTGAIWLLEIEVTRAERRVGQHASAPPPEPQWQDWVRGCQMKIPPALLSAIPLMHGLQENIIGPFRTAAMLADTFNGYTERWAALPYAGVAQEWPTLHGQIAAQVILLKVAIAAVQRQFPGQENRH